VDKQTLRITNVKTQTPQDLKDALNMLSKQELQIISGGTDMIIELRMKTGSHKLLDISHLKELQNIKVSAEVIRIRGGCTFTQILSQKEIQKYFPMLTQACSTIGSLQIRNKGTIGGNIVNAAPCADSYPPLIAYNAEFILTSVNGNRKIKADEFIIKNYKTQLMSDEILTEIIIPIPKKNYEYSYFQLGRRNAVNITRISIGILVSFNNNEVEECKLISGSLFHKPMRIKEIEDLLIGKQLTLGLIENIEEPLKKIIDDEIGKRWSSAYKLPVFVNMTKDALKEILEQRG
ncbi:MAG: FAD-binding protein, partial [Candidatus Cloacimonetes bacterium]|nr:FAD-binding protein [Candidatus Cloacimonadota bacterium]